MCSLTESQRKAAQRMAGHKAHATRKQSILQKVEGDISTLETAIAAARHKIASLQEDADLLKEQISTHERNAMHAEYQRRGYMAAATRKAAA